MAEVRAVGGSSDVIYLGDFRFEAASCRLWHADDEVRLRPKAAAVLAILVARAGQVVSKQDLLRAVWPHGFIGDNALSVCVNELRQVFGDDARGARYIATVHRRGYRLVAEISSARPQGADPGPLFVGRAAALGTLRRWWEQADGWQRRTGFVVAQAGVGKTALLDAFVTGLQEEFAPLVGRGQCVEQVGPGEPYLPMLEALAGLCRGPGGAGVREVLRRCAPSWLMQLPDLLDDAEMTSLRRRVGRAATPRMLREFTVAVETLSGDRPLVLVLEDLHDADRASIELISYLARRREAARLLLIGTYQRAEVIAGPHPLHRAAQDLLSRGLCRELRLEPLSEAEVGLYLAARLAPRVPSAQLVADVYERTEGNALFMVALWDQLIADDLLVTGHGGVNARALLTALGVPSEVRLMLDRRVDALDEADRVLLVAASAVGAEFTVEAARAGLTGRMPAAEVEERCDRLAREGVLLRPAGTAEWPDGTLTARYRFAHQIYREVLYYRLGPARRALVHYRIGSRITAGYGKRSAEAAAELARHFEHAQDYPAAVTHLSVAAQTALARSAYPEARRHAGRGLELLRRVRDQGQRSRLELPLRRAEVVAAAATWGWRTAQAQANCERLRELAIQQADTPALLAALLGLHNSAMMEGDSRSMQACVEQLDALARLGSDQAVQLAADLLHIRADSRDGWPAAVWERARRMLETYRPDEHGSLAVLVGDELGVAAHLYGGLALWQLGYPDQARLQTTAALDAARAQEIPAGVARALWFTAVVDLLCGNAGRVGKLAAELEEICARHELRLWRSGAVILDGWAAATLGETSSGLKRVRQGMAVWSGLASIGEAFHQCLVAELCLADQDVAGGLDAVLSGLLAVGRTRYVPEVPELLRLRGELLLLAGNRYAAQAEQTMLRALRLAEQHQARSFQLRATVSLTRLWHAGGGAGQPATLLGEVYSTFTEGHDTRDLSAASALLADLYQGTRSQSVELP
jgi:DNA-binding winged helix-turn-helix (wHTH) protein